MRSDIGVIVWAILLPLTGSAFASTWTVEKDGSGDFTLLQPAADSAAPGGTIRVGPGRWEELTTHIVDLERRDAPVVAGVDCLPSN